ncbi:hypothetical protein BCK_06120 [Bacillus cereus FRI-35]|nr:hypothetical protein BCK_06120 [Bacillus cereus FRI-35]
MLKTKIKRWEIPYEGMQKCIFIRDFFVSKYQKFKEALGFFGILIGSSLPC